MPAPGSGLSPTKLLVRRFGCATKARKEGLLFEKRSKNFLSVFLVALALWGPAEAGDAARGRAIVANRQLGLCLLCHAAPIPEERFQGTLGPDLRGVGSRLSAEQIRQRIVDAAAANPQTIMPPYGRTTGLVRVARPFQGRTILDDGQIDDLTAWLTTLKEE